jgi:hypothetical protein
MTWTAIRAPVGDDVHILPDHDNLAHTYDDCICGPTTECVPREDGTLGWMLTHHSLDGRELNE